MGQMADKEGAGMQSLISPVLCESTMPMSTSKASTSMVNWCLESGWESTGAVVNSTFSLPNAASASADQANGRDVKAQNDGRNAQTPRTFEVSSLRMEPASQPLPATWLALLRELPLSHNKTQK